MIGKGRRKSATEFLNISVNLLCDRGHQVGMAWKDAAPVPEPHNFHVSRVRWVESDKGGMVTSTCERCGSAPQWRWARIVSQLNENEAAGRATGTMSP
mgnify:CR=1 FL=1